MNDLVARTSSKTQSSEVFFRLCSESRVGAAELQHHYPKDGPLRLKKS
jgi:hypothetical protein